MHCHFCRHASGSVAEYARSAIEQGIEEICVTPHIPLPGFRPGFFNGRVRMDLEEFDSYQRELEGARSLFPRLAILSGIEADYIEGMEEYLEGFLSRNPFDLVLLSVHFVREWGESEWVFDFKRNGKPLERVYSEYFHAVRTGVETGLFDCVAHLDLIKQPGFPVLATNRHDVEELLDACRERGMSAEINMSGARKRIAEAYPSGDIVRLMIERGLPLTVGSDAHSPSQVGMGIHDLERRFGEELSSKLVRYRGRTIVPAHGSGSGSMHSP
jgi:histidinol-phosphatase (PHP family)